MSDKKTGFFQTIRYNLSNWDPFGLKKHQEVKSNNEKSTHEFRQWMLREKAYLQSADGLQRTGVAQLINLIERSNVFFFYSDRYVFFGDVCVEYRLDLQRCALFSVHAEIGLEKIFVYNDVQNDSVVHAVKAKEDKELQEILKLQLLRNARKKELCKLQELPKMQSDIKRSSVIVNNSQRTK